MRSLQKKKRVMDVLQKIQLILDLDILNLDIFLKFVAFLLSLNLTLTIKFSRITQFGHVIAVDQKYD